MQKKNLAIGIALAFVAFSAIAFVLYQQQQNQPLEQDYKKEFSDIDFTEGELSPVSEDSILHGCGALQTLAEKDLCLALESTSEQNADKCTLISERPARIDCIRAVAVDYESDSIKEKLAYCEEISVMEYNSFVECMDALQSQMLQEKLAICNKYFSNDTTQKYMCQSVIARNLGNISVCDPMLEPYKQHCINMVQSEL